MMPSFRGAEPRADKIKLIGRKGYYYDERNDEQDDGADDAQDDGSYDGFYDELHDECF